MKTLARNILKQLSSRALSVRKDLSRRCYTLKCRLQTKFLNLQSICSKPRGPQKHLYFCAFDQAHEHLVAKLIRAFGDEHFDYFLICYDAETTTDPIFDERTVLFERGYKWQFVRQYLTPHFVQAYRYLFLWDADIDIAAFSVQRFLAILERNNVELGQPALSRNSAVSHPITLTTEKDIGRYTDFVEIMVPVFRVDAWLRVLPMIQESNNKWGMGYDLLARAYCGLSNLAVVDSECIHHTKPVEYRVESHQELMNILEAHNNRHIARMISYKTLR